MTKCKHNIHSYCIGSKCKYSEEIGCCYDDERSDNEPNYKNTDDDIID